MILIADVDIDLLRELNQFGSRNPQGPAKRCITCKLFVGATHTLFIAEIQNVKNFMPLGLEIGKLLIMS